MRSSGRSTLPTCRRSLMRAATTSNQRHVTRPPMSARSTGRVHRSRRTMHKVRDPQTMTSPLYLSSLASHSSSQFLLLLPLQRSVCPAGYPTPALLSCPWRGCRWPMTVPASSSLSRCPSTHSSYQTSACTARTSGVS